MGKKAYKAPKMEVSFDPDARKDYLTGFRKRKQERRRFGLAMQKMKDRKERLGERKDRREAEKERLEELGLDGGLERFDLKGGLGSAPGADEGEAPKRTVEEYNDEATHAMFGDHVTVTTVEGIVESDGEDEVDEELMQHKKTSHARKRQADIERWSITEVKKRVNLPNLKKSRNANQGSKLFTKAQSAMPRKELGVGSSKANAKGGSGKGKRQKRKGAPAGIDHSGKRKKRK
ncbi:unnamed protein product [Chrysoparadoxa australica]